MTRDRMPPSAIPVAFQVFPLSVERKAPLLLVPAYRVAGVLGSIARTEILPPYSGSCVHVPVSAVCAVETPTTTPERLRERHKTRITMMDRHTNHFCVLNCFIPLLLLDVPKTYLNLCFWFSSLPRTCNVLRCGAGTYHTFPEARNGLSTYHKCEVTRIATGLDKFEEPGIACNVKSLREGSIAVPLTPGNLCNKTSCTRYMELLSRSIRNSDLVNHSVVSAQYDNIIIVPWTTWT